MWAFVRTLYVKGNSTPYKCKTYPPVCSKLTLSLWCVYIGHTAAHGSDYNMCRGLTNKCWEYQGAHPHPPNLCDTNLSNSLEQISNHKRCWAIRRSKVSVDFSTRLQAESPALYILSFHCRSPAEWWQNIDQCRINKSFLCQNYALKLRVKEEEWRFNNCCCCFQSVLWSELEAPKWEHWI